MKHSTKTKSFLYFWDKHISRYLDRFSQASVVYFVVAYLLITYLGYTLLGETKLTSELHTFLYYLSVTASTVGYGDHSPVTPQGKLFTAIWVIPFALAIFVMITGKVAFFFSQIFYRRYRGKHMTNLQNHIVILGYNRSRTPALINQIEREEKGNRAILLVSVEQEENPIDEDIQFIHASSFTDESDLMRAGITDASCVVVDTDSDDATLTIALFVATLNPEVTLVANFADRVKQRILNIRIPKAECIANLGPELLAKSVVDPGSSLLHSELVSTHRGETQYRIEVPANSASFELADIFLKFKMDHKATILGIRRQGEWELEVNADLSEVINPGDFIYYVADERVSFNQWPQK